MKTYEAIRERTRWIFAKRVRIPQGHPLEGKIRHLRYIDLEKKDGFKRQLIEIEDKDHNKAKVLIYKDDFKPENRKERVLAHTVYGEATNIATVSYIKQTSSLDEIDNQIFEKAKKMRQACEVIGIKSHDPLNNVQLSGGHVAVILEKKQTNLLSSDINKAVGFIFGVNGPAKDLIVFPTDDQGELINSIKINGGRTLLWGQDKSEDNILSLASFKEIYSHLYEKARNIMGERMSEETTQFLTQAFTVYVPFIIDTYCNLKKPSSENYSLLPEFIPYIEEQLEEKLNRFSV